MATNVTVYDLENYPDNNKTVITDHKTVVPIGYEGDEQWVLSFTTNAYSDIANTTAIQDIYVQEVRAGWLKSSGLVGTGGKFTIDSTSKTLAVKLDASAGQTGGGGYYYITLDTGSNIDADTIAVDMETKIRAIPDSAWWNSSDAAYQLAYVNASVEYTNGKFYIISGSVSSTYTGTDRSSVAVTSSGTDTCYTDLGFNLSIDSYTVASTSIKEVLITSNYTTDTTPLAIGAGTSVTAGDALMITDGTNTDYFTALAGTTDTSVVIATNGTNSFTGIANSYVTASGGSKVQILREQDPDQMPVAQYTDVDAVTRWGIKSIANQIDFSA